MGYSKYILKMNDTQLRTLLVRTDVQPGESLQSLLTRLSKLNDYDAPDILFQLLRESVGSRNGTLKDRPTLPRRVEMYQQLAALTGINIPDLHAATAHLFATTLTPPSNSTAFLEIFDGISVPLLASSLTAKQLRPAGAAQFCPFCLSETAYHRLIWMPVAISICLDHRCLLLDCCQQCNKKVSIREIVETHCRRCKSNLAGAKTLPLNNDRGLLFQRIIHSWFMNDTTLGDATLLLPKQEPKVLYRLADGLQWAIRMLAGTDWPYLHSVSEDSQRPILQQDKKQNTITPYESYHLYTTAFKGMINWPTGFYEFLEAYRKHLQPRNLFNGGPKADLGNLYTQWLQEYWQHPSFEFIHEAFERYFIDTYPLNSAVRRTNVGKNIAVTDQLSYINVKEAARILKTTPKIINTLLRANKLNCETIIKTDRHQYKLISRVSLQNFQKEWDKLVSRTEAALWLGITERMLIDLVEVRLLSAEYSPEDGFSRWAFHKSTLAECLARVATHIKDSVIQEKGEEESLIDLIDASRQLFVVGLNAASILLCVAEGKLKAYQLTGQELRLGLLLFDRSDIQRYIQSVKTENGWIGREETTKLLGIKDVTLTRWVRSGLMPPAATYGHAQYFNQRAIVAFVTEHVTSEDAAKILGVGRLTVQKWARLGRLSEVCVSGPNIDGHHSYIFHKEKLTQWRTQKLTFGRSEEHTS